MTFSGFEAEVTAQQLGTNGIDNVVTNAERICTYETQRIELSNEPAILSLKGQFSLLVREERRIEDRLQMAPPPRDLRRLRRRAIYSWMLTALLSVAGFAFTLLSFAPFRLGWKGWLYCAGIAAVTPFLVEKLLDGKNMEAIVKGLTAFAAIAALASLMLLAVIRGDLLAHQIHQDAGAAVVIDDSETQPQPENNFYDSTVVLLRTALLLMAFTMEVGAGIALRDAWRAAPDASEDWEELRRELVEARQGQAEIIRQVTMLRNEPAVFAARFWRDFYRSLLATAARSAMTKLLLIVLAVTLFAATRAQAQSGPNIVIAMDLTESVAVSGPDAQSEFQKNVAGVSRELAEAPAGSHITVFGITDHSFAQPYVLLSAQVPSDPGYFGERLGAARGQMVRAWKERSARVSPIFRQTDIFGALHLASEIFIERPDMGPKELVIFSDMRQSTPDLDVELPPTVPSFSAVASRCGPMPTLHGVHIVILGADGAGRSLAYWQSLQGFWQEYFRNSGAILQSYSALREPAQNSFVP
jgi:hypothetical protein